MKLRPENRARLEEEYCEARLEGWDTYGVDLHDLVLYGVRGAKAMSDQDLLDYYKENILYYG